MSSDFFLGLDLGQATDYTALCVVERPIEPKHPNAACAVRHLQRFRLGTPYPEIVAEVLALLQQPQLKNATLVVDATGVGKAVVDHFRQHLKRSLVPVLITAGHLTTQADDGCWHVPKKELVSVLQVLLQTQRLKMAASLPEARILQEEMQHFQIKVTVAGNESFEAWRERAHDDLVLALALACWRAIRFPRLGPISGSRIPHLRPEERHRLRSRCRLYG